MASGLIVVQQYQRLVVQRLGTFVGTKRPGLRVLIPIIDNGTKVDHEVHVHDHVVGGDVLLSRHTGHPFP